MATLVRRIAGALCIVLATVCVCYSFAVRNTPFRHSILDCLASIRGAVRRAWIRSALPMVGDAAKTGQRCGNRSRMRRSGRIRHGGRLHCQQNACAR